MVQPWSRFLIGSLLCILSIDIHGEAVAQAIAYESFSYSSGMIDGSQGSALDPGFDSGWEAIPPSLISVNSIVSSGLNYPGVPATGGAIGPFGSDGLTDRARRFLDTSATGVFQGFIEDNGSGNVIGADGTVLWVAFLLRGPGQDMNALSFGDSATREKVNAGRDFTRSNWGVYRNGTAATVSDPLDASTHLMALRFNVGANDADTIDLFFDPVIGLDQPNTPSATTGIDDASFDRIAVFQSDALVANGLPLIDEIRFGNTFNDVVGVPEPATLGTCMLLSTIGALSGFGRRKRR